MHAQNNLQATTASVAILSYKFIPIFKITLNRKEIYGFNSEDTLYKKTID